MLSSYLGQLIRQCEDHANYQSEYRQKSLQYYNGDMRDVDDREGRSKVISNDLRSSYKKVMPSIMRTFFGGDKVVEYVSTTPEGDYEGHAEQATEYVNRVLVPDKRCGIRRAIHDAIFDALVIRTGILTWEAFTETRVEMHHFSEQNEEAMLGLQGEDIEVLNVEEYVDSATGQPLVDFSVKRTVKEKRICMYAVPRGSFLIMPEVDTIEESPIVGERLQMTRSELISRGYDPEEVNKISARSTPDMDEEGNYSDTYDYKGDDYAENYRRELTKSMEDLTVYRIYVKIDRDDDGVAELYKMLLGESVSDHADNTHMRYIILEDEMVNEAPYASVVSEMEPHQFEGHSLSEDVMPIQRIKTSLIREGMDNLYWQNNLQPAIDKSALEEIDGVLNPEFARPIWLKRGTDVRQAIQWREVPNISPDVFNMLEQMDGLNKQHTGVTDMAGGVDLDKFQSMSPTNAALISEIGASTAEMMIRELAIGGLECAFRGLLKLVVAHPDASKMVKLRGGEWVQFDPAVWDSNMGCVVDIGLGTGSRERDMLGLRLIKEQQSEIVSALGINNPFVTPVQVYNTLRGMAEASGFPSADPYFTKPNDESIQQFMEQQQQKAEESPEKIKAQTQMQIAQMKMQGDQTKAQQQLQIERAQLEADISVKRDELQGKMALENKKAEDHMRIEMLKFELEAMMAKHELALEREKNSMETQQMYQQGQMKLQEMGTQLEFKREENKLDRHSQEHQMMMKGQEHSMKMEQARESRNDRGN